MCPIPAFDHNNVLPPHLGLPTLRNHLSPYDCTIEELCHQFATSRERITILQGFLAFREEMLNNGVNTGFQWIDGSFVENIEISEGRHPRDLDVVTFYGNLDLTAQARIGARFPPFFNPLLSKANFMIDHYSVDITYSPLVTVQSTRYWIQLFTHNRNGVWKGILNLPINTPIEDANALAYLNGLII